MSDKPENCPAFPVLDGAAPIWTHGMSLRDWFAGRAMEGVLLACDEIAEAPPEAKWAAVGTICYRIADAMLKARKA